MERDSEPESRKLIFILQGLDIGLLFQSRVGVYFHWLTASRAAWEKREWSDSTTSGLVTLPSVSRMNCIVTLPSIPLSFSFWGYVGEIVLIRVGSVYGVSSPKTLSGSMTSSS